MPVALLFSWKTVEDLVGDDVSGIQNPFSQSSARCDSLKQLGRAHSMPINRASGLSLGPRGVSHISIRKHKDYVRVVNDALVEVGRRVAAEVMRFDEP